MNTNTLYDIYTINHLSDGEDLTVSLAKLQAERPNTVSHEEAKVMREFIGRHGKALAMAFRKGKATFQAVAEVLYAEDNEARQ